MSVKITENGDGFDAIAKALEALSKTKVYVGVSQDKSSRSNGQLNNAELLFIHTNGSPINKIPARPVIEPAVEENIDRIAGLLRDAAIAASEGDDSTAEALLGDAGTFAANAATQRFGSDALAPNADITIHGGWMRNKVNGRPVYVKGKKSALPLIDEGSLKGSITHIIEKE